MITVDSNTKLTVQSKPTVEFDRILNIGGIQNIKVPFKIIYDLTNVPEEKYDIILKIIMNINLEA